MNSKIIAATIVIIVLLGLGGYLLLGKTKAPTKTEQTAGSGAKSGNAFNNTTLSALLGMGQNLRCSFNTTGASETTQGTFYISKGNVRGDFNVKTSDGKDNQMSLIRTGDTTYIWGSALPTGIKMTFSLDEIAKNSQTSQYSSLTEKTNYNCMPWSVDNSLFTLPTNVKFTDLSSMMPSVSPAGTKTEGTTDPCASITDPTAKTACENALKQSGH